MYRPLEVIREYIVLYCNIRLTAGGGCIRVVPEIKKKSEGKHCPENFYGYLCCVNSFQQVDLARRPSV